ncbi:MAG TPA: hypothetical protein VKU80_14810 [Planctomycetota bacterium]|nr:hypothetical protein [Planctomycetota bacterium]
MIDMILVLLVCGLGAVGDEAQAKPGSSAAPAQDPDRPAIPVADLKALRENNIFAPRSAKMRPPRPQGGSSRTAKDDAPVKPRSPVVTCIYFDTALQVHQAILEDKNPAGHRFFKDPMFMKAGDEWRGFKLESLTQDKATFNKGGVPKEVGIGEPLPDVEGMPLSALTPEDEAGEDGGTAPPTDPAAAPSSSKKNSFRNRSDSRSETKSQVPENQAQTLENMKRRVKKNRPSDPEE